MASLRYSCALVVALCALLSARFCCAHEVLQQSVTIDCPVATVSGTLLYLGHPPYQPQPTTIEKFPCVVLIGGTLSNTQDGDMAREGAPRRDALKRQAQQLASAGYCSLRYDKVGYGESKPKQSWTGSYHDEAEIAAAAIQFARKRKDISKVIAVGESAGAYLACLAAAEGVDADAYIFLGGHCGSGEAIYEYNFAPLAKLADDDATWRDWATKNAPLELALGRHFKEVFAAAKAGQTSVEIVDGDFHHKLDLARRKEELDSPPNEMFRHIKKPALAVSGEFDLNVPPEHGAKIVEAIRAAGNQNAKAVTIAGVDHSFQLGPKSEAERLRERYNFNSFKREYSPELYLEMVGWLDDVVMHKSTGAAAK